MTLYLIFDQGYSLYSLLQIACKIEKNKLSRTLSDFIRFVLNIIKGILSSVSFRLLLFTTSFVSLNIFII